MSPPVKKEIRLLLPAWIAAMLLAIASFLLTIGNVGTVLPDTPGDLQIFFLLLAATLLGIASFGQEFNSGTFTLLLSQPIERHRIWTIKTTVLAVAFASVLLTLLISWELHLFHFYFNWRVLWTILRYVGLSALCAFVFFSGGLWTTLSLRRTSEAFWLTLLTPVILMAMVFAISEYFHSSDQVNNYVVPAVFLIYSLAGFFWARRLFLRAQDLQWTGGVIAIPSRKKIAEGTTASSRRHHWISALVWKELQLQQVNILIAAVVLALHLASVVVRQVHPNFYNPNVIGLLELIWVLWLAMPLLIGSAAVAEEHRIGIVESQLCLPVSRRAQFVIKFFVGLVLSLVLGGLMPFIVERGHDLNYYIFVVAAVIFFISFYASTLARTTLQAIGVSMVVSVAIYLYEASTVIKVLRLGGNWSIEQVGLELLRLYLGIPILGLVLSGLMYWNFKWLHPEGKLRWRNTLAVLASLALIFVCINAIYFRTWEFLTPVASPRGTVRLFNSKAVNFAADWNTIYAMLPDGRLWVETLEIRPGADRWTASWGIGTIAPGRSKTQFIGGSNWITVAVDNFQALGIQSDGSLWSLQRQRNPTRNYGSQTGSFEMARIGPETNWWQAAGSSRGFLLLKKDGSLWVWGTNEYDWHDSSNSIPKKLELDLAMVPTRFGQQTDWTELFSSSWAYARKRDGSIWRWTTWLGGTNHVPTMIQDTNLDGMWPNFVSAGDNFLIGVKTNGELWLSDETQSLSGKPGTKKFQLGRIAKWKTATLDGWPAITAIRSDGTLWKWPDYWTMQWTMRNGVNGSQPVQLGNYSNWVACPSPQVRGLGAIVLAADGSLWVWDEPSRYVWLAPSRKPVFLGNIFGKTN